MPKPRHPMHLQPGDKVKYLNSTGGGIVTRILNSRMVMVADEDGFEVPTLISELVKIDPVDTGGRFFREDFQTPVKVVQETGREPGGDVEQENDPGPGQEPEYLPPALIRNRKTEDIFLAFVPHDQKWLITGPVDVFLINNTSFDVIYNLFHRTGLGHFTGIDYGSLFAGTRHLMATVNREVLSHWADGSLQFLFHKEQLEEIIPPFNSEFQIDGKKFHKEGAYRESAMVNAKSIVVRVVSLTRYLEEHREDTGDIPPAPRSVIPSPEAAERPLIFRHQSEPRKAVVDLHIHELVEDPSNLQVSEILEFQKNYFLRCLDAALANHFQSVVFIHGVGNGILRNVLIGHLKKTEGIDWFDAPMSEYGVGALEVRIPHNR